MDTKTCPYCQLPDRTQHSTRRAGLCDGVRTAKLKIEDGKFVRVKDAQIVGKVR